MEQNRNKRNSQMHRAMTIIQRVARGPKAQHHRPAAELAS